MEKLKALLKSIRWINLFIIALTQYLVRYCIIIPLNKSTVLSDFDFFLLVLSTILIAAAGYIINDYFDTKVDRLNNRTVVVGTIIKRREAIITHFFWTLIGVILGFYLAFKVEILNLGFINLFSAGALWLYSTQFKKQFFIGNFLIGILSALVLIVVAMYDLIPQPLDGLENTFNVILLYAGFAFLTTIVREIVKDFEDKVGDQKMGYKTLAVCRPILAKRVVLIIGFVISLFLIGVASIQIKFNAYIASGYVILFITVPLFYFIYGIFKAKEKKDYYNLSQLIKVVMLTGTLSMLVFTLIFNS